jgi:hypothetical protein
MAPPAALRLVSPARSRIEAAFDGALDAFAEALLILRSPAFVAEMTDPNIETLAEDLPAARATTAAGGGGERREP